MFNKLNENGIPSWYVSIWHFYEVNRQTSQGCLPTIFGWQYICHMWSVKCLSSSLNKNLKFMHSRYLDFYQCSVVIDIELHYYTSVDVEAALDWSCGLVHERPPLHKIGKNLLLPSSLLFALDVLRQSSARLRPTVKL